MSSFPAIGSSIIELSEIDSTNDYAMQLANGGMAEHGTVIITNFQSKGKGQQGNQWASEPGSNLLFSVILDTSREDIQSQFLLNAAFCSGIALLLMEHFELSATSIKWPNDIFVHKKKIAGILIENLIRGQQWQFAIVGVGINVNQLKFDSTINATSIQSESRMEVSLVELRQIIFNYLNKAYQDFKNSKKIRAAVLVNFGFIGRI